MIERLTISGVHMHVGDDLQKYVKRKIGRLDRYVPRAEQDTVTVDVKLKEGRAQQKDDRVCEVIMHLSQETIAIQEATVNIFAAVDIAETKLKVALKKYKMTHVNPRFHQRLLRRLKHRVVEA